MLIVLLSAQLAHKVLGRFPWAGFLKSTNQEEAGSFGGGASCPRQMMNRETSEDKCARLFAKLLKWIPKIQEQRAEDEHNRFKFIFNRMTCPFVLESKNPFE